MAKKILIVGGVAGGATAAARMRRLDEQAEIILFESTKKYLKEHLGENKTLNISKWKSEIGTLRKEKDTLYSQMIDIRKKVEQAESVRSCIDKLLQEKRGLTQVKKQELGL